MSINMVNKSLKSYYDNYNIEEISCVERVLSCALGSFDELNRNLYLLLSKYEEAYSKEYSQGNSVFEQKLAVVSQSWNLNVELKHYSKEEIIRSLLEGNLAIVMINLRSLYYSMHFDNNDVMHPVLIKGYDEENHMFKILFNAFYDVFSNFEYKGLFEFAIREDDLLKCAESYQNRFSDYSDGKGTIIISNTSNISSSSEVWDNWIKKYSSREVECNEITILHEMCEIEDKKHFESQINKLINLEKGKNVFWNEVYKIIESYFVKVEWGDIKEEQAELCYIWGKEINRDLKNVLRGKPEKIDWVKSSLLSKEENIKAKLLNILNELELNGHKNNLIKVENNEDKIIAEVDSDKYVFEFVQDKIYNTWVFDESPKVYTSFIEFEKKHRVDYKVKLKRIQDFDANYMAGVVLKIDDDIVFFGYDSTKGVNIDMANKVFSFANKALFRDSFELEVIVNEEKIEFWISDDNIKLFEMQVDDKKMCNLGIGCKTYKEYSYLKLEMSITKEEESYVY